MALTSWLHLCPGGAISSLTDHDLTASEPRAHSGFSLHENDAPRNAISHQYVCWIWDKCRSLTIAEDNLPMVGHIPSQLTCVSCTYLSP